MLGADIVVAETAGLVNGELNDLLGARGKADLAHDGAIAAADDELDGGTDLVELHAEVREDLRGHPFALADEAQEQVLGADIVVVEAERFLLGKREDAPGSFSKLVESICHNSVPAL